MSDSRRYAVWPDPRSRSRSHGGLKVEKMADFKAYLLRQYACSHKLIALVNYNSPRQYLKFNWTDFWYSSLFGVTWPSNLTCSTFGKRILPLTTSGPAVPYGVGLCLPVFIVVLAVLKTLGVESENLFTCYCGWGGGVERHVVIGWWDVDCSRCFVSALLWTVLCRLIDWLIDWLIELVDTAGRSIWGEAVGMWVATSQELWSSCYCCWDGPHRRQQVDWWRHSGPGTGHLARWLHINHHHILSYIIIYYSYIIVIFIVDVRLMKELCTRSVLCIVNKPPFVIFDIRALWRSALPIGPYAHNLVLYSLSAFYSLFAFKCPTLFIYSLINAIIASVLFYQVLALNSSNGADVPLRTYSTNQPLAVMPTCPLAHLRAIDSLNWDIVWVVDGTVTHCDSLSHACSRTAGVLLSLHVERLMCGVYRTVKLPSAAVTADDRTDSSV